MSDWNNKKNGDQFTLSEVQKHAGLKSLRVGQIYHDDAIKILTMSEAANPKTVTFEYWLHMKSAGSSERNVYSGKIFRYQDVDNFYIGQIMKNWHYVNRYYFRFGEKVAGAYNWAPEVYLEGFTDNTWHNIKVEFCEAGGAAYCTFYSKPVDEWILRYNQNLSPVRWTDGGACGIGYLHVGDPSSVHYWYEDDTKVFY